MKTRKQLYGMMRLAEPVSHSFTRKAPSGITVCAECDQSVLYWSGDLCNQNAVDEYRHAAAQALPELLHVITQCNAALAGLVAARKRKLDFGKDEMYRSTKVVAWSAAEAALTMIAKIDEEQCIRCHGTRIVRAHGTARAHGQPGEGPAAVRCPRCSSAMTQAEETELIAKRYASTEAD